MENTNARRKTPLVSIVIKTHNRSLQLYRALTCLFNQTYKPIEIIVLDHDSSDGTEKLVKSFGDKVVYHRHKGSYRDMYNIWHEMVNGEFVSFLDDDDYLHNECIEKLAKILQSQEDIDVVFSRHKYFILTNGNVIVESISPKINSKHIKKMLLIKCIIPLNSVLIRKDCLRHITKIGPEIVGAFDWYLWIQLAIAGCKFHQHDEVLGFIQRSPDSVQFDFSRMRKSTIQCVIYYGKHLSFSKKIKWGYYYSLGYYSICYGIDCMENDHVKKGRIHMIKGVFLYCFSLKNRIKIIPAILILAASILSSPRRSRMRIEKIFRNYLFRTYRQKTDGKYKKNHISSRWTV
jgi:glycosyltransferase involved in cell wall biosynthesis